MRRWGLRFAALLVLLICFGGGTNPAVAQLDLDNLRFPIPQPGPVRPLIELDATVGVDNWRKFFSALADAVEPAGFIAYPFSTDLRIDHIVGMILWHDDIFVSLYNTKTKPGVFVIGLFRTNLQEKPEPAVAKFMAGLRTAVGNIPGAALGENYAEPAEATLSVPRPPLRVAEISVPTDKADEMARLVRAFARRAGFFVYSVFPDSRFRLRRMELWRTEFKIVIENPTRVDRFLVTISSYLPLQLVTLEDLNRLADLCIRELRADVGKIPGGQLTVK